MVLLLSGRTNGDSMKNVLGRQAASGGDNNVTEAGRDFFGCIRRNSRPTCPKMPIDTPPPIDK